ncbi:MAG: 2-phospho-L-lactate guanylyltransferase [Deltaproteobacteria bacterium]|nr:2-phospho-L-lactate guanylyltransferase [Deltaproteobacteria bacterium]
MNAAVVPVKSLAASKSRLLPELSRDELDALALAMVEDVVRALLATPALGRVAVATPDDRVAELARALGAEALHGPDPGLNEAIDAAARKLHLPEGSTLMVVLGDVAGAESTDLERLFDALAELPPGPAAVLAPSSDGGTAALLRRPPDAIPSCFGRESAARHREAASQVGAAFAELRLDSLAIDLDRAEDVERFLEQGYGGTHTRSLLGGLGWSTAGTGHEGAEGDDL